MGEDMDADQGIIPIEIRERRFVRIHGIPHDMTALEAKKIIRVIEALVSEQSDA